MDPIVKTDFSVTLSLVSENVLDNAESFVLKNVHYWTKWSVLAFFFDSYTSVTGIEFTLKSNVNLFVGKSNVIQLGYKILKSDSFVFNLHQCQFR